MNWRYRLLRIDSFGGLMAGLVVLLFSNWLDTWYQLPQNFIFLIALANVTYGCYSFYLLKQAKRPLSLIILLVIANLGWSVLCVYWAAIFAQTVSPFGLAHLLGEALFVGGLACLEWHYRNFLLENSV